LDIIDIISGVEVAFRGWGAHFGYGLNDVISTNGRGLARIHLNLATLYKKEQGSIFCFYRPIFMKYSNSLPQLFLENMGRNDLRSVASPHQAGQV
jgi:hypothetical protein